MGGGLQYKWEVHCWISLSSRFRSQKGTSIQMGGVLPYKLEVYCSTFFETSSAVLRALEVLVSQNLKRPNRKIRLALLHPWLRQQITCDSQTSITSSCVLAAERQIKTSELACRFWRKLGSMLARHWRKLAESGRSLARCWPQAATPLT